MNDNGERFVRQLEDYYRDEYPKSMRKKVLDILPESNEQLKALFDILIHNVSAQYRTVPDVKAVESALGELTELYPEFRIGANEGMLLLEHAPGDSDLAEWFDAWRTAVARGVNPWESEEVQAVLRKHGVNEGG